MKPRRQSRRESKRSATPVADAVRFDSAAAADAAFARFRNFTRRLIAVPKSEIASVVKRRKKRRASKS